MGNWLIDESYRQNGKPNAPKITRPAAVVTKLATHESNSSGQLFTNGRRETNIEVDKSIQKLIMGYATKTLPKGTFDEKALGSRPASKDLVSHQSVNSSISNSKKQNVAVASDSKSNGNNSSGPQTSGHSNGESKQRSSDRGSQSRQNNSQNYSFEKYLLLENLRNSRHLLQSTISTLQYFQELQSEPEIHQSALIYFNDTVRNGSGDWLENAKSIQAQFNLTAEETIGLVRKGVATHLAGNRKVYFVEPYLMWKGLSEEPIRAEDFSEPTRNYIYGRMVEATCRKLGIYKYGDLINRLPKKAGGLNEFLKSEGSVQDFETEELLALLPDTYNTGQKLGALNKLSMDGTINTKKAESVVLQDAVERLHVRMRSLNYSVPTPNLEEIPPYLEDRRPAVEQFPVQETLKVDTPEKFLTPPVTYQLRIGVTPLSQGQLFHISQHYLGENVIMSPRSFRDATIGPQDLRNGLTMEQVQMHFSDSNLRKGGMAPIGGTTRSVCVSDSIEGAFKGMADFRTVGAEEGVMFLYSPMAGTNTWYQPSLEVEEIYDSKELRTDDVVPMRAIGVIHWKKLK